MEISNKNSTWNDLRPFNLKVGYVIALSIVFFAFQLNIQEKEKIQQSIIVDEDYHIESLAQPHVEKVFIPPIKKISNVEQRPIIDDFKIDFVEEEIDEYPDDFEDEEILENEEIDQQKMISQPAPMVQPKFKADEDLEGIEDFVQRMPVFGTCFELDSEKERQDCSNLSVMNYIRENLRYPEMARSLSLEGTVFAQFVINRKGEIEDLTLFRELGGGTSEEIQRVINLMPIWQPGKQNFRSVKVRITIPIKFKLN